MKIAYSITLGLFRKKKENNSVKQNKKKYTVEELNKINESRWEKLDPAESDPEFMFLKEIQSLREENVDEDEIEQIMLSHVFEGKNTDKNGNSYWVCGHCAHIIKFKTREDYITHHFRAHS